MSQVFKVSLPGYNAITDTNTDHFALYVDTDSGVNNTLIKEKERGSVTIVAGDTAVIPHDLGYVPFFMVYANDTTISADTWSFVGVGSILSSLYVASADTTDLVITNFTGASVTFKYFIFYDNQVGSSGVVINQSEQVVKVTKDGFNTLTETDPNNYIFHSDLNTFKIVYQGKTTITVTVAPQNSQFAHNSPLADTTCILMFAQFPDGKVTPVSWYGSQANSTKAYSNLQGLNGRAFDGAYYDDTNIYVPNTGGTAIAYDVVFVWYIFEAAI